MCNICKYWHHRTCLHPSFLDRDLAVVKKDFVLLICQACAENRLHLVSAVPAGTTNTVTSKESQCNLLVPPVHSPIVDEGSQTTPQPQAHIDITRINVDDDVQIIEEAASAKSFNPRSDYYVIRGIDDPCSNLYEFEFTFPPQAKDADPDVASNFCSAEQAFQYIRTLPHDSSVAQEILAEPNPFKTMQIAKKCPARKSEKSDTELMTQIIQAKVSQCRAFRDAMRSATAMGLRFLHSTYPADKTFASGLKYDEKWIPTVLPGKNILGAIVTDCAKNLKPEEEYSVGDTRTEFVNGIAVILHDGERLPISLRSTPFPHTAATRKQKQRLLGRPLAPWERNPPPRDRPINTNSHRPRQAKGPVPICFHCGVPGHVIKDCRLKHVLVTCRLCGQNGHKQKYCLSDNNGQIAADRFAPNTSATRDYKSAMTCLGSQSANYGQIAAPAMARAPLLRPTNSINDSDHPPPSGIPFPTRTPCNSQPNQSRGYDYNVHVPIVAQSVDLSGRTCPPVYVPNVYPGTYGLSYYQNFPPLTNSTHQNF
jgi:hypothetical protein